MTVLTQIQSGGWSNIYTEGNFSLAIVAIRIVKIGYTESNKELKSTINKYSYATI